jgi:hypothetical protein
MTSANEDRIKKVRGTRRRSCRDRSARDADAHVGIYAAADKPADGGCQNPEPRCEDEQEHSGSIEHQNSGQMPFMGAAESLRLKARVGRRSKASSVRTSE